MTRFGIMQVVSLFAYLIVQVVVLKNIVLFHTAFCFLYVACLLVLPVETNKLILMAIGFFVGFTIDVFNDSLGLHALACVFIMYFRNYWLNLLTPQGGYDSNAKPALSTLGLQWFLVYAVPLVFVHNLILFYVEAGGFSLFWFTLWKAVASTLFTSLVMVIVQFLFPVRRRI